MTRTGTPEGELHFKEPELDPGEGGRNKTCTAGGQYWGGKGDKREQVSEGKLEEKAFIKKARGDTESQRVTL